MNEMAFRVTSNDGTTIAYDRKGSGPAVVLVGGALDDGAENASLVPALAEHFTVYNYARRGRGASGFTEPYAVEREIEDLDALIAEAGGSAHLFGASSGGALALEAAAAGSAIDTIAVWEVPYAVGDDIRPDVGWSYPTPLPESQKIAGLISFYPEKVDVYVDGEPER